MMDDDRTRRSSEAVAHATGGVVVTTENIDPLVERLRALSRETVPIVHHPMRLPCLGICVRRPTCGRVAGQTPPRSALTPAR